MSGPNVNCTHEVQDSSAPSRHGCALVFKALNNNDFCSKHLGSKFGIWSVEKVIRSDGTPDMVEYDSARGDFQKKNADASGARICNKLGSRDFDEHKYLKWSSDDPDYYDETDEYGDSEWDEVDENVEHLLAKSEAIAHGQKPMAKRRKVKRAGYAAVGRLVKCDDPTSEIDFQNDINEKEFPDTLSSFASVRIRTDSHIQEMGRLFKAGINSVAKVSDDCNIRFVEKIKVNDISIPTDEEKVTSEEKQKHTELTQCRNLFEKLSKCDCETIKQTVKPKTSVPVPKENKEHKIRDKKKLLSRKAKITCKKGQIVIKLKKQKKEKRGKVKRSSGKVVTGKAKTLDNLTDFEKALGSADTLHAKLKPRCLSKVNTAGKLSRIASLPTANLVKEIRQHKTDVYIDVAGNPQSSNLGEDCVESSFQDQLTGFTTIEEFDFQKGSTNNNKGTLNRKEYFHNSHLPGGYLSFTVNCSKTRLYSFELDHYAIDLFRVPVKEQLVGTTCGRKRKVDQVKDVVKCKIQKTKSTESEPSEDSTLQINDQDLNASLKKGSPLSDNTHNPEQDLTNTDESIEDKWELEDYELQAPAVEIISYTLDNTHSKMNDIPSPVVVDCVDQPESDKLYLKRQNIKKDSANITMPSRKVHTSVEDVLSVITLQHLSNVMIPQAQNATLNNNKAIHDKEMLTNESLSKMPSFENTKLANPLQSSNCLSINPKCTEVAASTCQSQFELDLDHTSVESIQNSITDEMKSQSTNTTPEQLEKRSSLCATVTSSQTVNPMAVVSTICASGINQPALAVSARNIQKPVPEMFNTFSNTNLMTFENASSLPVPLMALAEIASKELTTSSKDTPNSEEIHRQALAKILPSPIVSPVAKIEEKHTPSTSPSSCVAETRKKTNQIKFSLDENGKVSHQGTEDMHPSSKPTESESVVNVSLTSMYYSPDRIAESKRKKKYAFAQNFITELSSDKTKQNTVDTTNCVSISTNSDDKLSLLSKTILRSKTKEQTVFEDQCTAVSKCSSHSPQVSLATPGDFKHQILPHVASFITPQNHLLLQNLEKMKSARQLPPQEFQLRPPLPHQGFLNRLPAFARMQQSQQLQNVYTGTQKFVPSSIVTFAQPISHNQFGAPLTSISHNQFGAPLTSVVPSNSEFEKHELLLPVQDFERNCDSKKNTGSLVSNTDHHSTDLTSKKCDQGAATTGAKNPVIPTISQSSVGNVNQNKVLPKVSPQNLMIYQKQLANKQTDSLNQVSASEKLEETCAVSKPHGDRELPLAGPQKSEASTSLPESRNCPHNASRNVHPNNDKIIDIRDQLRSSKTSFKNQLEQDSAPHKGSEMSSGLDLLSAAANHPSIVMVDECVSITGMSLTTSNMLPSSVRSFSLPQTPPESVNDRDDLSDSMNVSSADHLELTQFCKAELFEELLKRQSLTRCICGCSFLDTTMYMLHRASHNTDQPHMCAYCGKNGRSWMDFYAHMCDHSK